MERRSPRAVPVLIRGVLVATVALWLSVPSPAAQKPKSFADALGTVDDLAKRIEPDMVQLRASSLGIGNVPYLPALGAPPKRVALVSFYVRDLGTDEPGSPLYTGKTKASTSVAKDGAGVVATGLLDAGMQALRGTLGEYGMQLLTPDQYLDSAKKRSAYTEFEVKASGLGVLAKEPGVQDAPTTAQTTARPSPVAEGYRLLRLPEVNGYRPVAHGSGPINESLGDKLARALEVDAVLIVYNNCDASGKTIRLQEVNFYIFGPNPVKGQNTSSYWTGHLYVGLHLGKLEAPFLTVGKKGIKSEDYRGYERVMTAMAQRAGTFLREKTGAKQ